MIQLGLSPVKKTPENVAPDPRVVTKGINAREIRFCSAMALLSVSSVLWISNAFEYVLINFIFRDEARGDDGVSAAEPAGRI